MTQYQPPVQQQSASTYGQNVGVAPAGTPGQPIAGQIIAGPPAEIKWSGLETGGSFHLPVTSFIGRLTAMIEDNSSTYGLRIVEKYDQVQILASPVPWPWATIDPSIKYSAKENSAWGHHIASAKALGLAVNAATLGEAEADLIGKTYEMQQSSQSYGDDKATGNPMQGDVWKFVRIVQAGQQQVAPQPQYAQPQGGAVAQAVTPAPAPAPAPVQQAPAVTPAPAPQADTQAPAGQTPAVPTGGFDVTLAPSDTPELRGKKLLQGRALNEWLGAALMDDIIKANGAFINTIYDQSFIVGLKASGQITQGADGKFTVIS